MYISPNPPFYTLVSNLSYREVRLPKPVKIAQTAAPLSNIYAIDTDDREVFPTGTPDVSTNYNFHSLDCKVAKKVSLQNDVSVLHHEAVESQDSQIPRHPAHIAATRQDVQDRQEEFKLCDKYSQHYDEFVDMLVELQKMKDRHLVHINVAKHRIELRH